MIRTFITSTQTSLHVVLDLPNDYLGQELELIIFKKQEGLIIEKTEQNNIKLSDKYKGVFTIEDAKSFNGHTQEMRKEWNNI
jgi:hypothetical protein